MRCSKGILGFTRRAALGLILPLVLAGCSFRDSFHDALFNAQGATLSLSTPNLDFGTLTVHQIMVREITVKNNGQLRAQILGSNKLGTAFAYGRNAAFPGFNETCQTGGYLAPGETCTFSVQFIPTDVTSYSDTVQLKYVTDDTTVPATQVSLPLTGGAIGDAYLFFSLDGYEPVATQSNQPVDLGHFALGAPTTIKFSILYGGIYPATGVTFNITNPDGTAVTDFSYSSQCPLTVTGTCEFDLTSNNTISGTRTVTLLASWSSGSTGKNTSLPITVEVANDQVAATLLVQGMPAGWPGRLVLSSNAKDNVLTLPLSVNYRPDGTLPATAIKMDGFASTAYSTTGWNCPSLVGTASCPFNLVFNPNSTPGTYNDTLEIEYANGNGTVDTPAIPLTAKVLRPARLQAMRTGVNESLTTTSPPINDGSTNLNYPNGPSQQFTLAWLNDPASANAGAITFGAMTNFVVDPGTCAGAALGPETGGVSSCTFSVRFAPKGSAALNPQEMVAINYNDGRLPQQIQFPIYGTTLYTAKLEFATNPVAFGSVVATTTVPDPAASTVATTLHYYGSKTATVKSITGGATPFTMAAFNGSPAGECNTTITKDCSANLTFAPTTPGTYDLGTANQYVVNYDRGDGTILTATLSANGQGVSPATLAIVGGTFELDFGPVQVGTNKTMTTTIQNTGGYPATLGSGFVTYQNALSPNPFSSYNNCPTAPGGGATIAPGGTCVVSFVFAPGVAQANVFVSTNVVLTYSNGIGTQTVNGKLTGTGSSTATIITKVVSSPGAAVVNGRPNFFDVSVQYLGADSLVLQSVLVSPADYAVDTGTFPGSTGTALAVGSTYNPTSPGWGAKTAHLKFQPQAVGSRPGSMTMTFQYGSGQLVQTLTFSGTGTAPSVLTLTQPSAVSTTAKTPVTFGVTVTDKSGTFAASTITGSTLTSPFRYTGNTFPGTGSSCGTTISGSCALKLDYAPTQASAVGGDTTQLSLTYKDGTIDGAGNDVVQTTNVITITGTATTSANLVLTPVNGGNFGKTPIGTTPPLSMAIVVSNNGTAPATVTSASFTSGSTSAFQVSSNGCTTPLAPNGNNCTITVTFGSAVPGPFAANFTVGYSGSSTSTSVSNSLQGSATVPMQIAVGDSHTCAITDIGQVKCWGLNDAGQLGLGYPVSGNPDQNLVIGRKTGREIVNLPAVNLGFDASTYPVEIRAGGKFTCVRSNANKVFCWGDNTFGELGGGYKAAMVGRSPSDMGAAIANHPVPLPGTPKALTLGYAHACALLTDQTLSCWGYNQDGELGIGTSLNVNGATTLARTDIGASVVKVDAGQSHTCAQTSDNRLKCWGQNTYRQLGLSGATNSQGTQSSQMGANLPYVDIGSRTVVDFEVGGGFTVVVASDGLAYAWGYNKSTGNLGRVYCQNDSGAIAVCDPLVYNNPVSFYGDGPSQMGANLAAIQFGSGATAKAVTVGNEHVCLTLSDNTLKCFGGNFYGQLGVGDTIPRGPQAPTDMGDALPLVQVGTGLTVARVMAGMQHTCAQLSDGSAKCWGDNTDGQLGYINYPTRGAGPGTMGDALPPLAF